MHTETVTIPARTLQVTLDPIPYADAVASADQYNLLHVTIEAPEGILSLKDMNEQKFTELIKTFVVDGTPEQVATIDVDHYRVVAANFETGNVYIQVRFLLTAP